MAQKTAVDWIIEQLQAPCRSIPSHIIEQAKQMEKEQIIKSWDNGSETEYQYHVNGEFRRCSFDYYNETFGK